MPQPLFNPNDGLTGRDGGPYLDVIEMEQAEVRRAQVENREPDFDNLQATAGVPLVTAEQLVAAGSAAGNPSQERNTASADALRELATSEIGVKPVGEGPTAEELEQAREAAREADTAGGGNDGDATVSVFADEQPVSDGADTPQTSGEFEFSSTEPTTSTSGV